MDVEVQKVRRSPLRRNDVIHHLNAGMAALSGKLMKHEALLFETEELIENLCNPDVVRLLPLIQENFGQLYNSPSFTVEYEGQKYSLTFMEPKSFHMKYKPMPRFNFEYASEKFCSRIIKALDERNRAREIVGNWGSVLAVLRGSVTYNGLSVGQMKSLVPVHFLLSIGSAPRRLLDRVEEEPEKVAYIPMTPEMRSDFEKLRTACTAAQLLPEEVRQSTGRHATMWQLILP